VVQLAVYYLHARGLDPRVVLRGFADARRVLAQLRRECPDACRALGRVGPVDGRLGVGDPYDQMPPMRWLVGIDGPAAHPPLRVGDTAVVVYGRSGEREQAGFVRAGYRGLATFAPVTDPVVAR
jgi:hypothetical protein